MIAFILKRYLWLHEILHKRIISRLGRKVYGGLHPKEILGRRAEMFRMYVCPSDVVLDVACGSGDIIYSLRSKIKTGYGIDLSDKQIGLSKKHHVADNIHFKKIDIFKVDYKKFKSEVKYNVAIFSHIIEHINDVSGFLKRVDADKVLICVPSYGHWYRLLMMDLGLDIRTDRGHIKEYDMDVLIDELDAAGYKPEVMGYNSDGDIFCGANKLKKEV